MELGLQFEELKCYSCVLDTVTRREETQEAIVPDALPDIGTVISATATPFLFSCRTLDGSVTGEGEIQASVLYQPEGGGDFCAIPVRLPFRCGAEAGEITARCRLNVTARLLGVDVKVMNPRKILVQAEVALHFLVFADRVMRYSTAVSGEGAVIQTKTERRVIQYVSQVTEKTFPFEESIPLSGPLRNAVRILSCDCAPYCNETKLVGSKVVFKGGIKVSLRCADDGGGFLRETLDLPVSQVLDAGDSGEGASVSVSLTLTDAQITLSEQKTMECSLELYACAALIDQREVSMLCDAYSTRCPCACENHSEETLQLLDLGCITHPFRQAMEAQMPAAEVLTESVSVAEVLMMPDSGARCRLKVSVCLRERDGRLTRLDQSCYVELPLPDQSGESSPPDVELLEAVCISAAGGMEVRGSLLIRYAAWKRSSFQCLKGIQLDEDAPVGERRCPSAVLRMLRPGETLWELGKEYFATVDDIMAVNQISDESAAAGRFLLIPRDR